MLAWQGLQSRLPDATQICSSNLEVLCYWLPSLIPDCRINQHFASYLRIIPHQGGSVCAWGHRHIPSFFTLLAIECHDPLAQVVAECGVLISVSQNDNLQRMAGHNELGSCQ